MPNLRKETQQKQDNIPHKAGNKPDLAQQNIREMLPPHLSQGGLIQIAAQAQMYKGPIPVAEEAERYEALEKGSFNRILMMAENTNAVNNSNKERIVRHTIRFETLGLSMGFTALLCDIGAALYAAMHGHDMVATALLGLAIIGVISKLIPGKATKQKEE